MLAYHDAATFTTKLSANILEFYRDKILGERLKELVTDNGALTGYSHYVVGANIFNDDGRVIPVTHVHFRGPRSAGFLHDDMYAKHAAWWQDYQDFLVSEREIIQTLRSVMARAKNWQDVRDMLPDNVLRDFLQEEPLLGLSRTRPDVYAGHPTEDTYEQEREKRLLHWDPFVLNMYARVGGVVDVYRGYKFL